MRHKQRNQNIRACLSPLLGRANPLRRFDPDKTYNFFVCESKPWYPSEHPGFSKDPSTSTLGWSTALSTQEASFKLSTGPYGYWSKPYIQFCGWLPGLPTHSSVFLEGLNWIFTSRTRLQNAFLTRKPPPFFVVLKLFVVDLQKRGRDPQLLVFLSGGLFLFWGKGFLGEKQRKKGKPPELLGETYFGNTAFWGEPQKISRMCCI